MSWFTRINFAALALCFVVVVVGAYVRLSDAGLGCPDWPGCYGHVAVPEQSQIADAQQLIEPAKAWREMIHRYLVGTLGLLILVLAALSVFDRANRSARPFALASVAVVIVQSVFGMLTVTMKLAPIVVTTHLLLGLTTLALVWLTWLSQRRTARLALAAPCPPVPVKSWALLALLVLALQIFLGGWTSTNYAAASCADFPGCGGSFVPAAPLAKAFTLWHGQINYEYGILDVATRATIQLVHRYGAVLVTLVLGSLGIYLLSRRGRPLWSAMGSAVLAALMLQVLIGVSLIEFHFPLWLADAHNAGAAVLLLVVVALNYFAWTSKPQV
jgi:cytochrome c oxidase assembly protein subunit 15